MNNLYPSLSRRKYDDYRLYKYKASTEDGATDIGCHTRISESPPPLTGPDSLISMEELKEVESDTDGSERQDD